MALPTAHRLKRTRDFAAIRERGRAFPGRHFILAVLYHPAPGHPHAGFTTTKRIGNAVARNRVRRQMRAIVREFWPQLDGPVDFVTIAKYPAVKAGYPALRQEWEKLARKAGLLGAAPRSGQAASS